MDTALPPLARGDHVCELFDVRGLTIPSTRVALNCEWTSLTTVAVSASGIMDVYGERTGSGLAMQPVNGIAALATRVAFRNARRSMVRQYEASGEHVVRMF